MHDFPAPRPAKSLNVMQKLVAALGGAAIGGVVTYAAVKLFKSSTGALSHDALIFVLMGFGFGFLLSIIIHELGHAAMGVLHGMRLISLGIGPLKITRDSEDRYSREWIGGTRAFAGYALLVPPKNFPAWRMAMFALAGPLVNFLQALICLSLATISSPWLASLFVGIAISAGILGTINIVPLELNGLQTDGKQVWELSKGGESVRLRMAMIASISESMRGVPPWQLDRSEFSDFIEKGTHPARFSIEMYTYATQRHASDADADATLRRIADAFEQMPAGFREGLAAQIATSLCLHGGDPKVAQEWLEAAKGGIYGDSERELAKAAMALAHDDHVAARAAIAASRKANPKSYDAGWLHFTEWQLQLIEQRLR